MHIDHDHQSATALLLDIVVGRMMPDMAVDQPFLKLDNIIVVGRNLVLGIGGIDDECAVPPSQIADPWFKENHGK
ncbi:hypothetical protein [Mesorhizobium sp.]|uniref:hypothetical protein n=1 Tax=Mesorhizobium sp. TaxID=1871066 RepID=UPI0025C4E5CA|nr:hypothetical protein [Mesorhizobium sp.]